MRKIQISAMLLFLWVAVGCSKERDYDIIDTEIRGKVDFTAYNVTVAEGDSAVSTLFRNYFEEDYSSSRSEIISFDYTERYYDNDGQLLTSTDKRFETRLEYDNMLWSGGNNEIRVTFRPSCPEEQRAVVNFPDGTKVEVSASSPTCEWILDSSTYSAAEEFINGMNLWYELPGLPIYVESYYKKGNFTYSSIGYVLVEINSKSKAIAYDRADNAWYATNWTRL